MSLWVGRAERGLELVDDYYYWMPFRVFYFIY